ncbi:uncharacterized protein LOC124358073 [Homalodisca vitripennis]|uniref:uncharacterized protein LOC124358073 n=1 Tax=Homalodisca vitripennis TaxID=197043 RepID=UPI001EE9DDDE|nr:uncharacterized protein LOC124358073 [Homalodisca vitripennis]
MNELDVNLEIQKRKRKKGVLNKSEYKAEIIKKARVSGSSYISWTGKEVPEITPGEDCKCRRKCFTKVADEERKRIFETFRSLGSKNEQDNYLQSLIAATEVKQKRRRKSSEISRKPDRGNTFIYEVSTPSGKQQVCKLAFSNIHGISSDRIRRLTKLLTEGKNPQDMRGKSVPGNAKPTNFVNRVKEHIASFPVKITHYGTTDYSYLNEKLNVLEMYKLFKQANPDIDIGYKFYLKIFKENFTLHFGRPQVDTCCTCEALEIKIKSKFLNDIAKRVHVAEKIVHKRRAKKFYYKINEVQEQAATNENIGGICIDYMQNLQLPTIPVQETFYLRQLTVSVFCVHNLKDNSVVFFMYHEGIGGKGPNEVCSFLLSYIQNHLIEGIEHLHIFSDGCGGQNKNHSVLRLANALASTGKFKTVEQYFPIRGHSFLPCDRDFSVIKRKVRRCDRVYTVKEYAEMFLSASLKNEFYVVLPESEDILNFKDWWPAFFNPSTRFAVPSTRSDVSTIFGFI